MHPHRAHRRRAVRMRYAEFSKTPVLVHVRLIISVIPTKAADPSAHSIPTVRPIRRASVLNAEIRVQEHAAKTRNAT